VHADDLQRLSQQATALEKQGRFLPARELWLHMLPLLPRDSKQLEWIQEHARALNLAAAAGEAPPPENPWAKKLGPLGPVAVLLIKGKAFLAAIFKLKFLLSFAAFIGVYWQLFGAAFGIGFAMLILIHEMGHFIDIKRRGLPAEMPVFLPGLGAYVEWKALGVSLETRAAVSLAGPLAGAFAAIACAVVWWQTGNPLWAALARAGAWLNILNLIPVWMLDGGQAALALSKTHRFILLTACVGLWIISGENVFFLVALGALWRIFTKDLPPKPSPVTIAYFLAVLATLAIVVSTMPGQGFGPS